MTRYFEKFYNSDPMIELTETAAFARGRYVALDDGPPAFYRRIFRGELDSIIYSGWNDPKIPLDHFRALSKGPAVTCAIYSLAEGSAARGVRWRTWYVSPQGEG